MRLPSVETLRLLFDYDSETGKVFWRWRKEIAYLAGREAGHIQQGYLETDVLGRRIGVHRIVWALHHGEWAYGQIDHINGDRLDNRIVNLREVTNAQNAANQRGWSKKSPYKGLAAHGRRWQARIRVNGELYYLGIFPDAESAARAYDRAARKHFGEFARLNFPEAGGAR